MKIGIPRALLYFKYEKLWTTFFDETGIEYIVSPETDKDILTAGERLAIDETCLPTKLLLGHIEWLIGKCDYIFVPRIHYSNGYDMCTKFLAVLDLVINTFRDRDVKFLYYNVYDKKPFRERKAFYKMGKFLKIKRSQIKFAYIMGRQAQMYYDMFRYDEQEKQLNTTKNKVLVVAHSYNIGDGYVGGVVVDTIKKLGCVPIMAEYANASECIKASLNVSRTLPWAYNKHLLGAIELYKDKVDGIILFTTFPCGTDSMVNEMIVRKYKDKPIVTLTADTQNGTAGIETRLESFVDIINFKKGR
ncbi:MAG: hypothetical protein J1F36_00165 [Clostridiales bacterium]|nr:hypothetical protein [Clostridiales bacterium]